MIHKMKLKDEPFRKIQNGKKTIELRLFDDKRKRIRVGDEIVFSNNECPISKIQVKVINLFRFNNFKELYATLPLEKCGYSSTELTTACPSDMSIYYSEEEQDCYGVVGIEFIVTNITMNRISEGVKS